MVMKTVWSANCNDSQNFNKILQYNMHKNLFSTSSALRFQVIIAVLLRIQDLWDVALLMDDWHIS